MDYTSARLLRYFIPFLLCRVSVLTLALFGCRSHVDVLRHFVGRGHCRRNRFFKWERQRCSQIFLKDPDSHGKSPLSAVIFISGHLTEPTPVIIVLFCFFLPYLLSLINKIQCISMIYVTGTLLFCVFCNYWILIYFLNLLIRCKILKQHDTITAKCALSIYQQGA